MWIVPPILPQWRPIILFEIQPARQRTALLNLIVHHAQESLGCCSIHGLRAPGLLLGRSVGCTYQTKLSVVCRDSGQLPWFPQAVCQGCFRHQSNCQPSHSNNYRPCPPDPLWLPWVPLSPWPNTPLAIQAPRMSRGPQAAAGQPQAQAPRGGQDLEKTARIYIDVPYTDGPGGPQYYFEY